MNIVLRSLESADLGGLFVLVLVLIIVGNKLSQGYGRVRTFCLSVAGLLFVAYIVFPFLRGSIYYDNLAEFTFRGLLGAGFVLGTSWIVLPPLAGILQAVAEILRSWKSSILHFFGSGMRSMQEHRERRRGEARWAETLEKRKRDQQEAEKQATLNAAAQERRQNARGKCEVQFVTHSFEIRERFTREMFDAFVARHLGEDKPPDYVEKLAIELCDIIQKHLEKTDGRTKKSLAELAEWFLKEKKQIENTAMSGADKEMLVAQLEERYVRLQEKYLRSVQP